MAEVSLRDKVPRTLREKVEILSAGMNTFSDLAPTVEAELAARLKGYDLSGHRSRKATVALLETCDLILCMEPDQTEVLRFRHPMLAARIHTLKGFKSGVEEAVPDPFQKDIYEYQRILDMIDVQLIRIKTTIWNGVRDRFSGKKRQKGA